MSAFLIGLIFITILFLPNVVLAGNTSSLNFDGTNDYVNVGNGTNLNVGNTLTIMAWIRPTSLPAGTNTRVGIYSTRVNGNPAGSWQMEIGNGSGASSGLSRLAVTSPGSWNAESPNYSIAVGIWQHVAFTKESAAGPQKLFINGIEQSLVTNNVVTFIDNTNDHAIGDAAFSARYFPGQIDDVRLYKKSLTKEQIVQAMHDTYNDGLVSHWKFDDNTGCSAIDSSGNNNTGTLSPTCSSDSPTWHSTIKAPLGVARPNINDGVKSKGSGDYEFIGRTTVENSYVIDSINYSINNNPFKGVGIKDGVNDESDEEFEFNFRSDDNNQGYEGFLLDVKVADSGNRENHLIHFEPFNLTSVQKLSDETLQLKFNVHQNRNLMKNKLKEYQIGYTGSSISKTLLANIPIDFDLVRDSSKNKISEQANCSICLYEDDNMKVEYTNDSSTILVTTKNKFTEQQGKYTFKVVAQSKDNLSYESNGKTLDTTSAATVTKTTKTSTKPTTLGITTTQPSVTLSTSPKPTISTYTPPEPNSKRSQGGNFDLGQAFVNFHLWLFKLFPWVPVTKP